MRAAAKGLRQRVGHRGTALLIFALVDMVYAHALLFPSRQARRSDLLAFLADLFPLWVWALAWGLVGLTCVVEAFRYRDAIGFGAAISIKVMWATVAFGGWLFGGVDRGQVTAVVWIGFAGLVAVIAHWPEPPRGWKERGWTSH
ncbi:MAG: hypothetical protein WA890_15270 [Micromonospora sp.]